jgi:hypothetical protein
MRYPLNLRFKIAAIASQIYATDADGNSLFYVKQKLFKLKEDIEIYSDESKSTLLYHVKADRIIDFSPQFTLFDATGNAIGSVKRNGGRSIWRASYTLQTSTMTAEVKELNPFEKVMDALLSQVPFLGLISGYVFHPKYGIFDTANAQFAELEKLPAFFEGKYKLESPAMASADETTQRNFAALMMVVVLRERIRG